MVTADFLVTLSFVVKPFLGPKMWNLLLCKLLHSTTGFDYYLKHVFYQRTNACRTLESFTKMCYIK